MTGWTRWALPLVIFGLALAVRLPGLGGFLTADEPLWINRSRHFVGGLLFADYACPATDRGRSFAASGWGCTLQSEHPGVTTMWAGGLGLLFYYWQSVGPTGQDLFTFLTSIDMAQLDPAFIIPVRLPLAGLGALFVALFYLVLRRLIAESLALGAALLLALTPFHVALSRVLHHDSLTSTFMTLSLLALLGFWLRGWRWGWLLLSGVLAGLALLSKPVSWFLIPFTVLLAGLTLPVEFISPATWRTPVFWTRLKQRGFELGLWAVAAVLTYVILFPAIWTIPGEVFRVIFNQSIEAAVKGHGLYFLGQVSHNPGLLFYPVSWLLQATPVEVIGVLAAVVAGLKSFNLRSFKLSDLWRRHPIEVTLGLYGLLFLVFVTVAAKKLPRYFLPAFPLIEIVVVFGLLWLAKTLSKRFDRPTFGWAAALFRSPYFMILILFVQGLPLLAYYPYYFTYYNPLLGGAPGAARLTTVGLGEGLDQAAAYLNQLPGAESLRVAVCANDDLFSPFFAGQDDPCPEAEMLQSDYILYYIKTIQLQRDMTTWRYLADHYTPIHRVHMAGLDYVYIFRNPVEHPVNRDDNSLAGVLTTYGYNLSVAGQLRLIWQNQGIGDQALWVGLTSSSGAAEATGWTACTPAPGFEEDARTPGAIIESICSLSQASPPPTGLYNLQLGLGSEAAITPLPFSGLALVRVDDAGQFEPVDLNTALTDLATQALPAAATPTDVVYGDRLRLVGYQLEPVVWQPDQTGEVVLYWQVVRRPDFAMASHLQVVFRLLISNQGQPMLTTSQPMLPPAVTDQDWAQGAVMPVRYPVAMPADVQPGQYALDVCLVVAGSDEVIPGTPAGTAQPADCLPLSVKVTG